MATPIQLPAIPGTPADEWANKTTEIFSPGAVNTSSTTHPTTTTVHPTTSTTTTTANTLGENPNAVPASYIRDPAVAVHSGATGYPGVETPGVEVPGAFPGGTPFGSGQDLAAGMSSVLASAQQGFSAVASSAAQYLPQSVKEAAAPYLPAGTSISGMASAHDTVHTTSLPSTELRGAAPGEVSGGVGALPGSSLASGVAVLPHEQGLQNISVPGAISNVTSAIGSIVPQSVQNAVAGVLPPGTTYSSRQNHPHPAPEDALHPGASYGLTPPSIHAPLPPHPDAAPAPGAAYGSTPTTENPPPLQAGVGAHANYAAQAAVGAASGAAAAALAGFQMARQKVNDAMGNTTTTTNTSLPTTERLGAVPGEHSDGAGALPGTLGEKNVAVLPAETHGATGAAGAPSGGITTTGATSLPSAEKAGAIQGERSDGAGALPGKAGETGVAVLPAEHDTSSSASTGAGAGKTTTTSMPSNEKTGAAQGEQSDGAGALPGKHDETHVAVLPDERPAGSSVTTAPQAGQEPSKHTSTAAGTAAAATAVVADKVSGDKHGSSKDETTVKDQGAVKDQSVSTGQSTSTNQSALKDQPASKDQSAPKDQSASKDQSNAPKDHSSTATTGTTTSTTGTTTTTDKPATDTKAQSQDKPATDTKAQQSQDKPADDKASKDSDSKPSGTHGGQPNKGDAYGDDYHPAQLHPLEDFKGGKGGELKGGDKPEGGDQPAVDGDKTAAKTGDDKDKVTKDAEGPAKAAGETKAGETKAGEKDDKERGLKEGGTDKVHGGVPGDVGVEKMPTDKTKDTSADATKMDRAHSESQNDEDDHEEGDHKGKKKGLFGKIKSKLHRHKDGE